jgi:hypothetical protein
MINVVKLLIEIAISFAVGCLLLTVALVLLPKSIASRIITLIKPELFSDLNNRWLETLRFLVQQKLYGKVVQIDSGVCHSELYYKLNTLEKYCDAIVKNLYFVDLSIDLLRTLNFAMSSVSGEIDFSLLSQTFSYLHYYLDKLEIDNQDPTFGYHITKELQDVEKSFKEVSELRWKKDYDKKIFDVIAQKSLRDTLSYFEDQRKTLEQRLLQNKNSQELTIREIIDGIKRYPRKAKSAPRKSETIRQRKRKS